MTRQSEILMRLTEVGRKVDESLDLSKKSLELGRENATALTLLSTKLGVDGEHGRIPILEANSLRQELRTDRLEARVVILEKEEQQETGRDKLKLAIVSLLSGSLGAGLLAFITHLVGR